MLGGLLAVPFPAASHAQAPRIYSRKEWQAVPPLKATTILARRPDTIVVHHMNFPNSMDFSLEHAFALSRDCQKLHMKKRKWSDTGQQLTISRGGFVMEGRSGSLKALAKGRHALGAHAKGWNERAIGIEIEGTYNQEMPPVAQHAALVNTLAWLCEKYDLNPWGAIVGHRDVSLPGAKQTDCPGHMFYAALDAIRTEVAAQRPSREVR